jgi:steroid 5-alpha reductase family enzyme
MSPYLSLPLISWGAVALVMFLVWLWAVKIRNAGVVDIFWAFNFTIIAALIWFLADGFEPRKMLVCGLAGLWSMRLGIYLLIRVGSHLKEEEGRYKQLRQEWSPNPDKKFFFFFQMQAFSNVMLSLPFFLIALNPEPQLHLVELVGAGLWLLCIIGEGLSDWQLMHFKKNPANKGKVCQYGLWNYSRHPNYFFQFSIWVSVFIFAIMSPWGWLSIICPLSIGYLIFKVTGIPMTEEQAIRSKGEAYKEYQRTTSVFVPLPKKK